MEGLILTNSDALARAIKKAAGSAAFQWSDFIEKDDLEQELWIWYLESPSVRAQINRNSPKQTHGLLVRQAHRICAEARRKYGQSILDFEYSVDDARDALEGHETRDYVLDDLEYALRELRDKNKPQSELITEKFVDNLPMITQARRDMLRRGVENIADLMNKSHREKASGFLEFPGCTLGDGPGTRSVVSNSTAQNALGD